MKNRVICALAAAAALTLGGCGSSATETSASSSTSASASASVAAKVGDTLDAAELAALSSAVVQEKRTSHMAIDMGDQGSIDADVDYNMGTPKMAMTMDVAGEKMEIIYVDKVMYMSGDAFGDMTDAKWIKMDPKGEDEFSKMMAPTLTQMESSMKDPAQQLEIYEGATATVTKVDGDLTTYEMKVTQEQLSKALKAQTADIPGLTEETLKQLPDGMTYSMVLNGAGLPQSLTTDFAGTAMTVIYSKWGEPVDVKAPPASEVGTVDLDG